MKDKLFKEFNTLDTDNLTFEHSYCYVSTDYETECLVIKIPFPEDGLREFETYHETLGERKWKKMFI